MNLIEKNERMKELIEMLNKYRDAYYNQTESLVSDYEYDCLFDELQRLEEKTGTILSNSPTQTVGYEVKSELRKVEHKLFTVFCKENHFKKVEITGISIVRVAETMDALIEMEENL